MHEARKRAAAEVERQKVEEVNDENELGPVEVRADEEHDKGKVEEVVEDEVAVDAGRNMDSVGVLGEEAGDVAKLQDEEADPSMTSAIQRQHVIQRGYGVDTPVNVP